MIDATPVIRLKDGLTKQLRKDPQHWGSRTDYLCARSHLYKPEHGEFWLFSDTAPDGVRWLEYYAQFKPRKWKPSVGLCAVFMAIDRLKPSEIALIGCDRMLRPDDRSTCKWHKPAGQYAWGHDAHAENRALHSLGVNIIDLASEHGSIS